MAIDKTTQNKYRIISIGTVLVLLVSFAYYYFIYVNSQESELNEKAFRIIQNVGTNVQKKYVNYSGIVKNVFNHISINDLTNNKRIDEDGLRKLFDKYNIPKDLEVLETGTIYPPRKDVFAEATLRDDSVTIYVQKGNYMARVLYKLDALLKNTLRQDFFKKYIVFSDSMVFYADISTEKYIDIRIDSIFKTQKGDLSNLFHSTDKVEIEFDNERHIMYVTPVSISNTKTIYIGGIIEKKYFIQQSYKLGTNTMLVLFIGIVCLIISLPFLKLLLLSENERLSSSDAITSFVAMVFGSAFIVISLLTYFSQQGPSFEYKKRYLESYADALNKSFLEELRDISKQIDINDRQLKNDEGGQGFFRYDRTKKEGSKNLNTEKYKNYSTINWMNSNGEQLVKWRSDNITPRVGVSFRNYFKIPNQNGVLWKDDSIDNGIYIEAIHSITEGKTYAMISKRSTVNKSLLPVSDFKNLQPTVVSMGSKFQSMTNLRLPSNMSYMVVNQEGVIMFHKDPSKILQENILDETNNNLQLREAIYSGKKTFFRSNYDEVHSRFCIQPIGKLPLFLITFMDEEIEKRIDAQILVLASQFYFLLFLIVFLQIGIFFLVDYKKRRKTKGRNLFFAWLWPVPSSRRKFDILSVYIVTALILSIVGGIYNNVLATLAFCSLLVTVNILTLGQFDSFSHFFRKKKYPVYFFLSLLFGLSLFAVSQPAFSLLLVFLLFLVISGIVVTISFYLTGEKTMKFVRRSYSTWIILFILSISTVPVVGFFIEAYNFEKSVYVKYLQKDLAEKVVDKQFLMDDNKYRNCQQLNNYFEFDKEPVAIDEGNQKNTSDLWLINEIRVPVWLEESSSAAVSFPDASYRPMKWEEGTKSIRLVYDHGSSPTIETKSLGISSEKLNMRQSDILMLKKSKFHGHRLAMLIIFILLIFLLYRVVLFWTSRLFLVGIIPNFKTDIKTQLHTSKFTYIISLPYSGATTFIRNQYPDKTFTIDLRYLGISDEYSKNQVIPDDTEIALIYDTESNSTKALEEKVSLVHKLKKLVYSEKHKLSKICIVSPSSPHQLRNAFNDANKEEKEILNQYLDIIGNFSASYFNIGKLPEEGELKNVDFIEKELRALGQDDNEDFKAILRNPEFDKEDVLLNIQNKSQLYYFAIWNSLEQREKFLIYDLSQDGLVNYRNLTIIFNLLNRGILIYESGMLQLFNNSFANFVLSIIRSDETLEIEKASKKTGTWSNLKWPFYTIVVGVILFLLMTQQDLFNDLLGWITAALALLPLLSKFIISYSLFGGGGKK